MADPFWTAAPDSDRAFDALVDTVSRALSEMLPGDYWQILGVCPRCQAGLAQSGLSAHLSGMPKLPPIVEQLLMEFQATLTKAGEACPACRAPVDFASATQAYVARVAPLHFQALVGKYDRLDAGWSRASVHLFRPPGDWTDLGADATNNQVVQAWGRSVHPAVSGLSLVRRLSEGERRPVRWVSGEEAVTAIYAKSDAEQHAAGAAAGATGLRPPYVVVVWPPGEVPALLESAGAASIFNDLAAPKGAGIAMVFSQPAIRERLAYWSQVFAINLNADAAGRIAFSAGEERHQFSIEQLAAEASSKGFTIDEVLFEKGFWGLPMPGAAAARPSVPTIAPAALAAPPLAPPPTPSARAATPKAPLQPPPLQPLPPTYGYGAYAGAAYPANPPAYAAPLYPIVAPVAPPPAYASAPRAAPWAACRTCGRNAFLVRRMYDSVRLDSLYKPKPALAAKGLTVNIALMIYCGEHLLPVHTMDLTSWGLTPERAADEAARSLARDYVSVRRRVAPDTSGRPVVGLAGPFAASIATDPLWVESAIRASGVNLSGLVHVECFGENVITFRPKDQIAAGPVGRDLRKVTKAWGLPEPIIGFTWTKDFGRSLHAEGSVRIEGDV